MNKIIPFLLTMFLLTISNVDGSAQWRMDGGLRLGRSNIRFFSVEDKNGYVPMEYKGAFSWSAETNIGYEFKYGIGAYTGLSFDKIRCHGKHNNYWSSTEEGGQVETVFPLRLHAFNFLTVPFKFEYRTCHDIIRPYVGVGMSFMLPNRKTWTEETYGNRYYDIHRNTVSASFLYGVNLQYKRYTIGIEVLKQKTPFWTEDKGMHLNFFFRQVTGRLAFQIF